VLRIVERGTPRVVSSAPHVAHFPTVVAGLTDRLVLQPPMHGWGTARSLCLHVKKGDFNDTAPGKSAPRPTD
jgi:hypothetical protein